jgi:hypothetical protein
MSTSPSLTENLASYGPAERVLWEEQPNPRPYSPGRARESRRKNTIRFKCIDCGRQMEARSQDGGVDTHCPHCCAPLTVPRILTNPYLRPIHMIVRQIKAVPFPFPYLPQIVQLAVLLVVLGIFAFLFVTIGLVSQIVDVLEGLIVDARKHLREGSAIERSAQAVSIGIYASLWLPLWLIQLPFSFIGSLWSSHRIVALVTVAVLLTVIDAIVFYSPHILRLLQSF